MSGGEGVVVLDAPLEAFKLHFAGGFVEDVPGKGNVPAVTSERLLTGASPMPDGVMVLTAASSVVGVGDVVDIKS